MALTRPGTRHNMMRLILDPTAMQAPDKPSKRDLSRERILHAAGRAVRRTGYGGTSVAEVMKEAGLTHGGFYAHFRSRDDMVANAIDFAGKESTEGLLHAMAMLQNKGMSPFRSLVEAYLSAPHMAGVESGCVVAALGSEMPRQSVAVRQAAGERVRALIGLVASVLPPEVPADRAPEIASTMVGALQMARVLGEGEGRKLLARSRAALLERYD